MGNYTKFEYEEIEIKNLEGLKNFMSKQKDDANLAVFDGETVSFETWNNDKIIGYWYNETLRFLKGIARYIEGNVMFNYESNDLSGWVEFRNKKCILHLGHTIWEEYTAEKMLKNREVKI